MYEYTTFSVFEFTKSTLIPTLCIYYVANRQTEKKTTDDQFTTTISQANLLRFI